mmetsp:Transcript_14429/g.36058  ORF Transcript_14429/g.36058 Transcript_14429/m.36058 type:complete len:1135 (+) Transcript_14429:342-3746(+)|eukprot:CAMPEP_0179004088 /NCGR_PEP_ID=MMETSP0795-20121207/13082_1 /TAXON_ID=88552 /ORGANISM="Amoebophrya sp., Strain Ameob2" /LENGTH=1134 /DNA_ID=CAMNT_0020698255 /DNA_START=283 /DNA_END=3687 /DNA_ORIENTATION=-
MAEPSPPQAGGALPASSVRNLAQRSRPRILATPGRISGLALLLTLFVASPAVVFLWWKGWKFVADALFRLRQNGTDPADNSHAVRPLASNMNGEYELDDAAKDFETSFAKRGMEFFDVYSPVIATRYAEVYWTELGNLELPVEIRKRFEDGAIAITGYEHDQVFADDLEKSVPFSWAYNHHYVVYMTADRMGYEVLRKDAVRKWARGKMSSEGDPGGADDENGSPLGGGDETHLGLHHMGVVTRPWNRTHVKVWLPEPRPQRAPADARGSRLPRSQFISEANGGESRKSLHSYPDGFAQIVEQPRYWHVTPMQVDSRNRDCGVAPADVGGTCESLGIEPRQAAWGGRVPHAERKVTGLIECPCTSRFGGDPAVYGQETKTKSFRQQFAVEALDQCARDTIIDGGDGGADPAKGAAECFDAASKLLTGQAGQKLVIRNVTTPGMAMAIEDATVPAEDENAPPGCSARFDDASHATVFFHRPHLLRNPRFHKDASTTAGGDSALPVPTTCSGSLVRQGYALFDFGPKYNVTVQIDLNATHADLRLTGPANVWFGLAFNAVLMADQPYTILVLPRGSATAADDEHETETESDKTNKADIVEQQIGTCGEEAQHCPGDRLKQQSLVVLEDRFQGHNERRVRVVRSLQGVTAKHYSFGEVGVDGKTKPGPATINLMAAVGRSPVFAHHKAHRRKQIALLDRGKGKFNCVCYDKRTPGLLCDSKGQQCESFVKNCAPPCSAATTFPTLSFGASAAAASAAAPGFHQHCGDLIPQRNPTCASRTYVGGLQCCRHGSILLDADQADRPEKLCYRMKFRFWYKEMQPPASSSESVGVPNAKAMSNSFVNLDRLYYQTEGFAGEYEVPPAFRRTGETKPLLAYPELREGEVTPGTVCNCTSGSDLLSGRNKRVYREADVIPSAEQESCECAHKIEYQFVFSQRHSLRSLDEVVEHLLDAEYPTSSGQTQSTRDSDARLLQLPASVLPAGKKGNQKEWREPSRPPIKQPLSSSAKSGMYLIWANGHCHAPSCISMELFRNDTGQLLCRQEPRKGTGSGFPDPDRFDEEGYVFIPPCIWTVKQRATSLGRGAPKPEGGDTLPAAPFIPEGVVLRSVKRNRNTANGHFGEMASWQMRAVRADALVES